MHANLTVMLSFQRYVVFSEAEFGKSTTCFHILWQFSGEKNSLTSITISVITQNSVKYNNHTQQKLLIF